MLIYNINITIENSRNLARYVKYLNLNIFIIHWKHTTDLLNLTVEAFVKIGLKLSAVFS